ncbi:hypothetical protein DFS34DRAFT_648107 [Phlyctochytrium arcticum]|nr:hypothetical protein DFS34DRAFT_648107 [Phlyctochytrium arcticum]
MRSHFVAKHQFLVLLLVLPILLGLALSNNAVVDSACTRHPDAPRTFTDFIDDPSLAVHNLFFSRVSCTYDVAVYMSTYLKALPTTRTQWIVPFYNQAWKYLKKNYGGCRVDRQVPAPIGPGCTDFGAPKPLVVQLDTFNGVGQYNWENRFDSSARVSHRSFLAATYKDWSSTYVTSKQHTILALCLMVESASQGTRYPAIVPNPYRPMGHNTYKKESFANMCAYDFFNKTGYAAEAATWYDTLMQTTQDNVPPGAKGVNWFKNWFLPLYEERNNTMSFQSTYYGLLAQYFPTMLDGKGVTSYVRRPSVGEYVHFMSAAVGWCNGMVV